VVIVKSFVAVTTMLHACAEPSQPDVCVVTTPFTDVDETTHDEDALLDALTVEPSVVTVVATVVPEETVVSAGAPEADPSAIKVPAAAAAAKASPAAIHFNPHTSGRSKRRSYQRNTRSSPGLPKSTHCEDSYAARFRNCL
jgi:hypothetical protein